LPAAQTSPIARTANAYKQRRSGAIPPTSRPPARAVHCACRWS